MATQQELIAAQINYLAILQGIANGIDNNLYPSERARVGAWTDAAFAAGVSAGNVNAVLGPFNVWEEIVTTLSGGTIPREIQRVQQGGAIPHAELWATGQNLTNPTLAADIAPYQPPPRISLPDIATIVASQGGALAPNAPASVTVTRQDIAVPASVATSPNVTSMIAAQYPPPPPQTMDPPPGETATLPYPTSGISGPLPTAPSSKTGGGPATINGSVGAGLGGPALTGTGGGTTTPTGEPDAVNKFPWLLVLAVVAGVYFLARK